MGIKRTVAIAVLALLAGNGLADVISATIGNDIEQFPATPHQLQLLGARPTKIGEFARFEATLGAKPENTYRELPVSLSQLQMLGRTAEKARP